MKTKLALSILLSLLFSNAHKVEAAFVCSGVLTAAQQQGFANGFTPPYSPSLSQVGPSGGAAHMSKRLTKAAVDKLSTGTPTVVARATLTNERAVILKEWLNANAEETVPSWASTVVGLTIPSAWVALTADVFFQLVNASGTAGRRTAANLAGTVSQGGLVGITEHVALTKSGERKFLWTFLYQAKLNEQIIITPLAICSADVVVGP
jgi:hypothetical protein